MSRSLPIALVQAEPQASGADIGEFARHVTSVARRFPGAGLVVYPELHLFGGPREQEELAEPLSGPRAKALAELAGDLKLWLVPGTLCERGPEGQLYNTAVVFAPDGTLVAAYRKCFPWRPYEIFQPGNEFVVFDMPEIGRAGLSICYDCWFPEVTRQLAWQGAEFVITPTKTTTSDRAQELVLCRANAIVNQVYVLSVNAAAPGVGQSLVVDPEGRVRVDAGRTAEVLTDVIDLDDVTKVRRYGTAGLNRMWDQHRDGDPELPLPVYQGRMWTGRSEA
jgi:predicted amidohydrolase